MTNIKKTKRALLTSVLSMLLCVAMLAGTTFAWFTDSVTSSNNIIKSGNLDVTLEYWDADASKWVTVEGASEIFDPAALWEPGHTEVVYLKVANIGSLALKYQLGVNIVSETGSTNVLGSTFKLSNYIYFDVKEGYDPVADGKLDRSGANALKTDAKLISEGYSKSSKLLAGDPAPTEYVALVVYMPEWVGNEANFDKKKADAPQINLGINLLATQYTQESDSFDEQYDKDAKYPLIGFGQIEVDGSGDYETDLLNQDGNKIGSARVPKNAIAEDADDIYINVVETEDIYSGVTVETDQGATTYEVTVTGLQENNDVPVTIALRIGEEKNVAGVYHYGEAATYTYSRYGEYLYIVSSDFSPFTIVYNNEPLPPVAETPDVDEETQLPEGMPSATVTDADQFENVVLPWENFGAFTPSNMNQTLESAYVFKAPDTAETVANSLYKDWHCDYFVKMDKDVDVGKLFLGGNYGDFGWVGFENPVAVAANTEVGLLTSVTTNPWTYEMIVTNVGEFTCGVAHLDDSLDGATFTVMLRLTNPENPEEFFNVNTVEYTFGESLPEGMPTATVTDADQHENTTIEWKALGIFAPSNPAQTLESAYIFEAIDTAETVKDSPYKDWYCDYFVKMDRKVEAGALFLGGNYGPFGWVGFENPEAVEANTEVGLLTSVTTIPWTYEAIVTNVGEFTCGVAHLDDSLDGATFTVMLRLINPLNENEYYNVNTIEYTFQ
ncbi:MAG: hypothetical protein IJW16_00685 [Clostridia bacterium]|nr:hypothetical protein [Clostridia bacterium]